MAFAVPRHAPPTARPTPSTPPSPAITPRPAQVTLNAPWGAQLQGELTSPEKTGSSRREMKSPPSLSPSPEKKKGAYREAQVSTLIGKSLAELYSAVEQLIESDERSRAALVRLGERQDAGERAQRDAAEQAGLLSQAVAATAAELKQLRDQLGASQRQAAVAHEEIGELRREAAELQSQLTISTRALLGERAGGERAGDMLSPGSRCTVSPSARDDASSR